MAKSKIDAKLRFLPMMPYGLCSFPAASIQGKNNKTATTLALGNDPETTLENCLRERNSFTTRNKYLCDIGMVRDRKYICGYPKTEYQFRVITRDGLAVLTDSIPPKKKTDKDGTIKGKNIRDCSPDAEHLRELFASYAGSDNPDEQQIFNSLLFESVSEGKVTPLSAAVELVPECRINTTKYSPWQIYNIWRQSNILSMFRVNDFLTYFDRRPFDTGFSIDGITDEQSYNYYIETYGVTPAALCYKALTTWYQSNPSFYRFLQRTPTPGNQAKEQWLNTPVYYQTKELPVFNAAENIAENNGKKGNKRMSFTICVGLALGRYCNYVCYHAKPGLFKWIKLREERTRQLAEDTIHDMKTQNPEIKNTDAVRFALFFCTSIHQFLAIFQRTIERHKRKLSTSYLTDAPYTSIHIIPVNDSGCFSLYCLLQYSPQEAEDAIRNNLLKSNREISYSANPLFPLTFKGERVFLGHTMDIGKINRALTEHLDGNDFVIACFPEQVPWYQKLFPGKTFL